MFQYKYMKCIECQGTGLKDQNNVCVICEGFGFIESHQLPNEIEYVEEDIEDVEVVAPKPKKKSLISKFKPKKK